MSSREYAIHTEFHGNQSVIVYTSDVTNCVNSSTEINRQLCNTVSEKKNIPFETIKLVLLSIPLKPERERERERDSKR